MMLMAPRRVIAFSLATWLLPADVSRDGTEQEARK